MGISAICPADVADKANTLLEERGFGPNNFAIPLRAGDTGEPTFFGLHAWYTPEFASALKELASLGVVGVELKETTAIAPAEFSNEVSKKAISRIALSDTDPAIRPPKVGKALDAVQAMK